MFVKLFGLFGTRAKDRPPEGRDEAEELEAYSGMRVEVSTLEGQLLFVADARS